MSSDNWHESDERDEFGPDAPVVDSLTQSWMISHCHARIRILSGYCAFLLKRAYYYKSEEQKTGTVEFVKSKYSEMLGYKSKLATLAEKTAESQRSRTAEGRREVKALSDALALEIDQAFHEIGAKVSEKVPGEKGKTHALEMTDEELTELIESKFGLARHW